MYQVILYCLLNVLGFFFFLFVWNRIPKVGLIAIWRYIFPRPLDYTTIPGMKVASSADEPPPLSIDPGVQLSFVSDSKGNLDDIQRFPNFRQFLEYCNLCYGPLNSFYWGPRYVVSVASEAVVKELASYRKHLLAVCPLAVGSILAGDSKFWTRITVDTLKTEGVQSTQLCKELHERHQNTICKSDVRDYPDYHSSIKELLEYIGQVHLWYKLEMTSSKSIREILSRPLVVVFDEEIDIDAHPVPKYIPIVVHVGGLIQHWSTEEIWDRFYSSLGWVPGISQMSELERTARQRIRRETKPRIN